MQNLLKYFLKKIAQLYLARFKPMIVGVTGNVGKTSTKEAIGAVLRRAKKVRISAGNLNNEFGLPLSVIGGWDQEYYRQGGSNWLWLKVIVGGFFKLFFTQEYPEVLVLEYGADKPGDIKRLAQAFPPHIAVVTAIGEIPVHVEFFMGPKELAEEKSQLVKALNSADYAVLNFDDLAVLEMKDKTKAKAWTFGLGQGADMRADNIETLFRDDGSPEGTTFKLYFKGSFVPVKIFGSLGKTHAISASAAAALGVIFGMNLVYISEALAGYNGPAGRLKILKGIKGTTILDDSYNASPLATHAALETLRDLPGTRKIAVLGDMKELGRYSIEAHQTVGDQAGAIADILICVGGHAKFIADSAANEMPQANIYKFDTADEAKLKVQELLAPGDVILVKGSQSMRMEKVVKEIMAEPERAGELLVRQSKKWLNK